MIIFYFFFFSQGGNEPSQPIQPGHRWPLVCGVESHRPTATYDVLTHRGIVGAEAADVVHKKRKKKIRPTMINHNHKNK